VCGEAGVEPVLPGLPAGVERVRRGDHIFVLNHTDEPVALPDCELAAGDVAVLRLGRV
jgi:hypothetical protein